MRKISAMIEWQSRLDGLSGTILFICLMVRGIKDTGGHKEHLEYVQSAGNLG